MRMNRKSALVAGASLGIAFLAACSDSPTQPSANVIVPKTTFAVGAVTPTPAPTAVTGKIVVCKTGNVGGSFSFTRTTEGPNIVGSSIVSSPQTIANGTCLEVANDDSPSGSGSHVTITEAPAANTVQTITACQFRGYALDGVTLNPPENCVYTNGGDLFLNHFHGYVITYNNVFTPPPSGCTYTKGWYQNKNGAPTITKTIDGRTPDQQRTIFAATPGKPNGVTWDGGNNTLNLYQQLLAALNNLGGDPLGGPDAVDKAIADALAATGGSGLNITLVGSPDVGALITPLSNFNEGKVAGFPHCSDEVLQ